MQDEMDVDDPSAALKSGLPKFLSSAQFADLTITCKHLTMKVHKLCVCTQSKVLHNALKPGGFEESETSIIDLPDDDPLFFEVMINFMYKFDFESPAEPSEAMLFQTKLYALADKYAVEPLLQLILKRFTKLIRANQLKSLIPAVSATYSNEGVEDLRLLVVEEIHKDVEAYHGMSEFEEMMAEQVEMNIDLRRRMLDRRLKEEEMAGYIVFSCTDLDLGGCGTYFMMNLCWEFGRYYNVHDSPVGYDEVGVTCRCPRCGDRSLAHKDSEWTAVRAPPRSKVDEWIQYGCPRCAGMPTIYCFGWYQGTKKSLTANEMVLHCWGCSAELEVE